MSELTVVMIEPNKKPYLTKIKKDMVTFEKIVDGPVDIARFLWSSYRIVCNVNAWYGYENSNKNNLPEGTSFIVKYHDDFVSLSNEEAREVLKSIKQRQQKKSGIISSLFKR